MQHSSETKTVAVSLRGTDTTRFFSEHEIETTAGEVEPLTYEGRRYEFSHRIPVRGYASVGQDDLYVFVEATQ